MKIKIKSIYKSVFFLSIFYMYTKSLWDTYLGSFGKLLFYGIVFLGIIMFVFDAVIKKSREDIVVVIFFAVYVLYVVCNGKLMSNAAQFSQGMLEYILYTLYFLSSCYYVKKGNLTEAGMRKFVYLGMILSIFAIYEYITKTGLIPDNSYTIYYFDGGFSAYRARVFCESPMTLCMMLGILFLFALYLIYVKNNKKMIIPTVFLLIGMFCTGSRGPLIGALCGAVIIICLKWRKNPLTKKKAERTMVAFFSVIILLIILSILGRNGTISTGNELIDNAIKRFASATDFTNEWGNVARLRIWIRYIEVFKNHFWFGIGIAHTSSTVASNTLTVTESGLLKRLVETGFIGTLMYFSLVCLPIIYFSFRKKNKNREVNEYKIFTIALLVAVGIEDIVLQLFADVMSMYIFWAFIALMYCLNNRKERIAK